VPSARW